MLDTDLVIDLNANALLVFHDTDTTDTTEMTGSDLYHSETNQTQIDVILSVAKYLKVPRVREPTGQRLIG